MSISIDLTGRRTHVTGAGRGIGTGIALRPGDQVAGGHLIVSGGLPFHA
jgi:NAD(P)-dependent dehydrogenase (short-subunit alcohol dehydrogenase family)